ncbi:STAS domain-containing protein [Actinocorallia populi]|uniref:STAS domain-containing protein n=1 Tax=Actinocorallia populi TaxID=2079200 RepID=UPI000D08CA4B|nr:STAS domain-containing protein [Actinocorallia populi]
MRLALDTRRDEDRTLVTARGSIDLHSSESLQTHLIGLLDEGDRQIVVDLAAVDFCDSSGLNVLVRAYKHARVTDAALVVTGAQGRVENVLRTTGLDKYLIREL